MIMLWFCVILLGFWTTVQTKPISNGLDSNHIDATSSFDVQPDPDPANDMMLRNNSPYSGYSSVTSTSHLAEKNFLNSKDLNLRRRNPPMCRPRSSESKSSIVKPDRGFTLTEPSSDPCPDELKRGKKTPLTCAGPERWIWNGAYTDLMFVVNCEAGELFILGLKYVQNDYSVIYIRSQIRNF